MIKYKAPLIAKPLFIIVVIVLVIIRIVIISNKAHELIRGENRSLKIDHITI